MFYLPELYSATWVNTYCFWINNVQCITSAPKRFLTECTIYLATSFISCLYYDLLASETLGGKIRKGQDGKIIYLSIIWLRSLKKIKGMLRQLLIFICIEAASCRSVQSCIGSLAWVSDDMAHTSHLNTDKQLLAQDSNGKWVKCVLDYKQSPHYQIDQCPENSCLMKIWPNLFHVLSGLT